MERAALLCTARGCLRRTSSFTRCRLCRTRPIWS
jgi:hypothetical protein